MKNLIVFLFVSLSFCAAQTTQPVNAALPDSSKNIAAQNDSVKASINNYMLLNLAQTFTAQDYYNIIDSLKKNGTGDYFKLRMAYAKTPGYNPVDMDPGDLFREAYTLVSEANFKGSAKILDSILSINYVQIKAHKLLGYIYTQLGDPQKSKYHYDVYKGLVNSIFNSGDGKNPKTAFIIIEEREESDVYDALNLVLESHNYGEVDGHKFHLAKGFDELKDNTYTFFFNIDIPRNFLNERKNK